MVDREEVTIVTLTMKGEAGDTYTAQLSGGIIDVQVDAVETSFSMRMNAGTLGALMTFLATVQADPAAQPPSTLTTIPQDSAESSTDQEEQSNG